MQELTPLQMQNAVKHYNAIIKNCKKIKKILEKSWLWTDILESCKYIINNYTLKDELETWIYDYCWKNNISRLSMNDHVYEPSKITSFCERQLEKVKKALEDKIEYRDYRYWNFDYSISTQEWWKKARYSREYQNCWNWYYYLLLDYNHALFYEQD